MYVIACLKANSQWFDNLFNGNRIEYGVLKKYFIRFKNLIYFFRYSDFMNVFLNTRLYLYLNLDFIVYKNFAKPIYV